MDDIARHTPADSGASAPGPGPADRWDRGRRNSCWPSVTARRGTVAASLAPIRLDRVLNEVAKIRSHRRGRYTPRRQACARLRDIEPSAIRHVRKIHPRLVESLAAFPPGDGKHQGFNEGHEHGRVHQYGARYSHDFHRQIEELPYRAAVLCAGGDMESFAPLRGIGAQRFYGIRHIIYRYKINDTRGIGRRNPEHAA